MKGVVYALIKYCQLYMGNQLATLYINGQGIATRNKHEYLLENFLVDKDNPSTNTLDYRRLEKNSETLR